MHCEVVRTQRGEGRLTSSIGERVPAGRWRGQDGCLSDGYLSHVSEALHTAKASKPRPFRYLRPHIE